MTRIPDDPTEPGPAPEPEREPMHEGPKGPRPVPEADPRVRSAWCN